MTLGAGRAAFWTATLLVVAALALPRLNHAGPHVAFIGDSITQEWFLPRVNLGKHGETTAQMAARFPGQVLGHGYRTVVILGGTNDRLLGLDPDATIENLRRMAEAAEQAHIQPVLCEIPPIFHDLQDRRVDYSPQVIALNEKIKALAATGGWKVVDYYDAIAGHPGFSSDGVHMKRRGYLVMEYELEKTQNVF